MSWMDDYLKSQQGATAAVQAGGGADPSWTGGFISSAFSAIPELFGEKPSQSAVQFRADNPWSGMASQLIGGIVPYAGMGVLSETATGAKLLGEAMEALPGVRTLTAVDNSILHGAVKEAIRYSPVELARLGVGLGTTDNWHDYGNLFADVGLSALITGGFGGIGGFFRVGGKALEDIGGVEGAPIGLRPTFELRMADSPDAAPVNKNVQLPDVQNQLVRQVYTETPHKSALPGQKDAYVQGLEGGNPETDSLVNTLFKPATGEKASMRRQPLMDPAGNWNLSEDDLKVLEGGLAAKTSGAIKSTDDLARVAVFPRLLTVNSPRVAGTVSKALDDSAMQWVSDGVMAGKEANGGLHVMAVRLRAGTGPETGVTGTSGADVGRSVDLPPGQLKAPTPAPPKIAPGDKWLLFKTDKPQLFAPEGYRLAQATVDGWAQFRNAWRPSGMDDFANKDMDMMIQSFTPQDFKDATTLPKVTAKANIARRLASRFAETAGLDNSSTINGLVDSFFDVMAPTVVNERRNPLFARLFGTMRSAVQAGETIVNKVVGGEVNVKGGIWTRRNLEHTTSPVPGLDPLAQVIGKLTPEELQDYVRIGHAQAPADKLAEYTANGQVSANLLDAVEKSQAANRWFWENHLMPAFKNANLEGKFDLLNGYFMPRMFTGDWFAPVTDEFGNLHWLGNGTPLQAKTQAQAVIDQAAKVGRKLVLGEPYLAGAGKPADLIGNLHDLVQMQIGKDDQMQEIVQRAMKKLALDQASRRTAGTLGKIGPPKNLMEERTGIGGSPDLHVYKHEQVIQATKDHYSQLMRFAAVSAWRNRFLEEAKFGLRKENQTLFNDLIRKQNQIMGYEGQFTAALNKSLAPILGPWLGGKAATKIASATNGLIYAWNIGIANPTFAVLNVLQPIQTVLPHLSFILQTMKHNLPDALEADMRMSLRYGADGKPREVIGVLDPAKILARAFRLMGSPDEELKGHLGQAKTDGTLQAQLFEGWYGGQSRGLGTLGDAYRNAGGGGAGAWEVMKRGSTLMAERSEEVSRGIAFNSYYILGKDYLGLSGDKLYRFMRNGTRNSMFGYSLMDRSRMFTGPIGSMFGLFKNWQLHFISSMFQYAKLGWDHGIWGPALWQFGAAGALGGLGAMGPLKHVADGLASWHDNSPNSYLWMQEHWHGAADEIYFGLPALFGSTLQASTTLPGTDVRNDLTSLSNFVFLERAKAAGKAVGAAWDYGMANGQDPLREPHVRDQLMQAFAPRAFFRAFASVDGDYIKSMATGNPAVRGVNPLSKILYGAGLNQVEVERQQVAAHALWDDQTARQGMIQQLGIALADAQMNGDWDEMERVNMQAVAAGLPVTSIYSSARTRLNRQNNQDLLSRYRGEMVSRYRQAWEQ